MINNPVVSSLVRNYKCSENAFLPHFITVPLAQEYKITCKSLVASGDIVEEGQVIAKYTSEFYNDSYIHAPLPGKVIDVVPCFSPNGKQEFGIKIQFNGKFSYLGKKVQEEKTDTLFSETIIREIEKNGVVNTFTISEPENLSREIKDRRNAKCVVVRLFDEDPYRVTDYLITKMYFKEILLGAQVLAKAVKAEGVLFAIDTKFENKKELMESENSNLRFVEMNVRRYPCGTRREIVSAFKRNLKKNCAFNVTNEDLYIDASTAYEVYKAVICKTPSMSRLVHFSGDCINSSCLLNVRIGTTLRDIVNQLGGFVKAPSMIQINGSICGKSVINYDVPITKYVKSVCFVSKRKLSDEQIYSCISCGNCRFACPVHISPDVLYNNASHFQDLSVTYARTALACLNCGLCNTVCPSRLPLSQTISVLKDNQNNVWDENIGLINEK